MDKATPLCQRGKTFFQGTTPPTSFTTTIPNEGMLQLFDDTTPGPTGGAAILRRSGRQNVCRLVRNVSGIALGPKRTVKWAAGYRGRRVDGYCHLTHGEAAGVVDDHYTSAGIPNNDLGWLCVSGPCLVLSSLAGDAENVIAEGDVMTALTAATSQATTAGRIVSFVLTSNATLGNQVAANRIGRAMSAKTTGNTNADVLIDLEILKAAS